MSLAIFTGQGSNLRTRPLPLACFCVKVKSLILKRQDFFTVNDWSLYCGLCWKYKQPGRKHAALQRMKVVEFCRSQQSSLQYKMLTWATFHNSVICPSRRNSAIEYFWGRDDINLGHQEQAGTLEVISFFSPKTNQSGCPSLPRWTSNENVVFIHNGIFLGHRKI